MADLFPPMIEGKLPAQAGTILTFELQHNPTVNASENTLLNAKISSVSTNSIILNTDKAEYKDGKVTMTITSTLLKIGEYYKIQFGYHDSKYYSNIGIFKYTATPTLSGEIDKYLNIKVEAKLNDVSEPIHSYTYQIIDQADYDDKTKPVIPVYKETFFTTDYNTPQTLLCQPNIFFNINSETLGHWVKFDYLTVNKLNRKGYSLFFDVTRVNANLGELNIVPNFETGICNISFQPNDPQKEYRLIKQFNGKYIILTDYITNNLNFFDLILEPGKYHYFIEAIDSYTTDNRNTSTGDKLYYMIKYSQQQSNAIFIDFEYVFLSDNKKQLCIKFNPKIGSFKNTILESKLDTLGGQYPFFFRNGNLKYKEMQLGGLISYHMDKEQLFSNNTPWSNVSNSNRTKTASNNILINENMPSSNLTGENISEERKFKLEVLEWLTNGQPKLLRSPTEGSYIVRLMNVSLAPEEQLGRMLHSFSATAYEVADCTIENLKKYNCLFEGAQNDVQH